MERKIDEWSKSQNVSSEQTDRTDPPPPQAYTEHVNSVFTGSGKFDDSLANQKDPPPPIIVLGSRKVLVTSIVSLDSLYNNIWNLNKVNGPKPMKSPQGLSIAGHGEDCSDFEDSRARSFVHRSPALQSLACLYWESDILNLID
ncbi:hypothetical protein Tco_0526389 [Tanacetum coccineum]